MATRVYFPETGSAAVTPPAPIGSTDWEHINSSLPIRPLLLAADATTLTTTAYTPDAADDLTNRDSCHRQYVSASLKAQTFSGNVTGQFQCLEALANCNLFLSMKVLVCSSDGATTRATLLAITRSSASEAGTSLANRTFPSTALTGYTCIDGDRLVVEVGLGGNITSGSGGNVGHNGSLRFGTTASSGDLPVDNTQTGTTYRPWVEFSVTVKWLVDSDGASTGAGASVVVGAALWNVAHGSAGVGAGTGLGVMLTLSAGASAGISVGDALGAGVLSGSGVSSGTVGGTVTTASAQPANGTSTGLAVGLGEGFDSGVTIGVIGTMEIASGGVAHGLALRLGL